MTTRLSPAPFSTVYGQSAAELLRGDLSELEIRAISEISGWVTSSAQVELPDAREPMIALSLFEPQAQSLLALGFAIGDVQKISPDYDPAELEESAALLVSVALLRRGASSTPLPVATSDGGDAAAKTRGWQTLAGPGKVLKAYKDELTTKGEAVLLSRPELLSVWRAAPADGSFIAMADAVQVRLDLVKEHAALFTNTRVDTELVDRGKKLLKEARVFFRGREGREIPRQRLTQARDLAFSMLLPRLERLRVVLRSAYFGDALSLKLIDGTFFKNLARISKARKPRKAKKTPKEITPKKDPVYLATASD